MRTRQHELSPANVKLKAVARYMEAPGLIAALDCLLLQLHVHMHASSDCAAYESMLPRHLASECVAGIRELFTADAWSTAAAEVSKATSSRTPVDSIHSWLCTAAEVVGRLRSKLIEYREKVLAPVLFATGKGLTLVEIKCG